MNNIKDITIKNYRGIHYAEVSGMARVNVFLGNNNCGKSSVLESVLMLLGANSPALPLAVNVNRNYSTVDKTTLPCSSIIVMLLCHKYRSMPC